VGKIPHNFMDLVYHWRPLGLLHQWYYCGLPITLGLLYQA